ncbi:MAG TPA: ABC transporter substrate-binding protein [Clostridiales bacterium]|nr:ABC transporter substrate-binding protein [Clostridiales bacterium]
MKKVSLALVALLILSALMAGCSGGDVITDEEALPKEIRIGVFEPFTGANASGGELEKQGIDLAYELYPTVTIKGTEIPVILHYVDNKSDKIESANAARELVEDFGAHIVLGSWGGSNAIAAGPVFLEAKVPAIGTSCTSPLVTIGNDYYFRVCFIDSFQGKVMANYAFNEGFRKIAIIQEDTSNYSVALANYFSEAMVDLTGDEDCIVSVGNYNTGDNDFRIQLTAIKNSEAEAIFAPGNYTESALIMKQARELGIMIPFLGGDTWETPDVIEIAGKAAEGAVYSTSYDAAAPLTGRTKEFLDAYAVKFGKDTQAASVTALGFDSYLLAVETIEKSGTIDGPTLRDTLAQTMGFEGATGYITLDENGDAIKPAVIKIIQDGKFVYKSFVKPF